MIQTVVVSTQKKTLGRGFSVVIARTMDLLFSLNRVLGGLICRAPHICNLRKRKYRNSMALKSATPEMGLRSGLYRHIDGGARILHTRAHGPADVRSLSGVTQ